MNKDIHNITSRQFMVFILAAQIGVGVISVPSALANFAGHDGWISILLSGLVSIAMCFILIKHMERYDNKSLFEIHVLLYGKYIGMSINIIIILYLLLKGLISLRTPVEILNSIVLIQTPPLVLTLFIIFPTVYLTWYGLKAMCRFSGSIFISIIAMIALLLFQLKYVKITFLMPVGKSGITSILEATIKTSYSFLAFANLSLIYPHITDKDKTMKYTISTIIYSTLFFISVVVVTTGFFGEKMLKHLTLPIFSLAMSYRSTIFERMDLFFLITWYPAMLLTLKMYFFMSYYSINKVFNLKDKIMYILLITILLIFLSRIPRDFSQVYNYLQFSDMIGVPIVFGLIITNYLLSFVRTRGVRKK